MNDKSKLDHCHQNIEDYLSDEPTMDDMGYLVLGSDDDFKHYMDYRTARQSRRLERDKRDSHHASNGRSLWKDREDVKYG